MSSNIKDFKEGVSIFAVFLWALGAAFYSYEFALRTGSSVL